RSDTPRTRGPARGRPPRAPLRRAHPLLLRHATPARNLNSILRRGLPCSRSRGRLPVVWLHTPGRSAWAVPHTVRRHGGRADAVVIVELEVPRRWLRRSRKGLWCCTRDVPAARIRGLIDCGQVAGTSAA